MIIDSNELRRALEYLVGKLSAHKGIKLEIDEQSYWYVIRGKGSDVYSDPVLGLGDVGQDIENISIGMTSQDGVSASFLLSLGRILTLLAEGSPPRMTETGGENGVLSD